MRNNYLNILVLSLFLATYVILFSTTSLAQTAVSEKPGDASSKSLFDMTLEEALGMEVTTASKLGSRSDISPANVKVITQEDIRRYGYRTIGEALNRDVSFNFSDNGAVSITGFRGQSSSISLGNDRIMIMIDGLRYNERNFDTASLNEVFPLDIESVERIEILKGAGSAIWGSNAMYAVINVISKDGSSDRNKQVMGEYASHNRGKGYVSYGDSTEGGFKYFTSVSATDADGHRSTFYPMFDDPSSNFGVVEGSFDRKSRRVGLKTSYEDLYLNFTYGSDEYGVNLAPELRFNLEGNKSDKDEPTLIEGGYKLNFWKEQNGELLIRSYFANDHYRTSSTYKIPQLSGLVGHGVSVTNTRTVGSELRYTQDITSDIKGLVGIELSRVYKDNSSVTSELFSPEGDPIPDTFSALSDQFQRTDESCFFDISYSPLDELGFFFGGRWDKPTHLSGPEYINYPDELPTAFGPRAAIIGKPLKHTIVKLLYSEGFRNAAMFETGTYLPEPRSLDPEKLESYEVMVEQRINDWGSVTASLFYNELSDVILPYANTDLGLFYTNFKGLRSKGIELGATTKFDRSLTGYLNYIYADARDLANQVDIENVSSQQARAGFSFTFADAIIASPEVVYGSSAKTDSGYRFDSYWYANLTLLRAPVSNGFEVSASIYNLFDNVYERLSTGTQDGARSMENGRELRVQGTWRF